jgi:hypothetical protein
VTAIKVQPVEDCGYLIQGTDNPREARRAVWAHVTVGEAAGDYELDDVRLFVRRHHLSLYRVGWFRKNPCGPNWCGDHGWHLGDAKGPGPGNFRAVLAEVW